MSIDPVTIDTGYLRPGLCAAYLLVENSRAALIDCGTATCAGRVLDAIDAAGVARDAVDWLLVTHVHLDHAGGAGPLMQALPNVRLVVHPRGAAHMIDPARLIAGATAVYGEAKFARDHAGMLPVEASRVVIAEDGHIVELGNRVLECVHTPGHALHHYSVWDARARQWFAGDTFGISYREFDNADGAFILPTTSPVQFDPEALKHSIRTLVARTPALIHLTHYAQVHECARLADELIEQIDLMVALTRQAQAHPDRQRALEQSLTALYLRRARAHGINNADLVRHLLANDIQLNAQGLNVWLDRQQRAG